jgi:hypothetical protein
MEVPDPPIPEVQSRLVALHLVFDDLNVDRRRLAGERLETSQIPLHTIKNPPLELEEIGIDAHPVAGVFPVGGSGPLPRGRATESG